MGAWERNVQRKTSLGVQNLGQERVITEEEKKRVHSVKCCRKSGFKGRGAECGPSALGAKDGLPEEVPTSDGRKHDCAELRSGRRSEDRHPSKRNTAMDG